MSGRRLVLRRLDGHYAVVRLAAGTPPPEWALGGELWSIAGAPGEISVVCEEHRVPSGAEAERGWSCLEVAGPLDFSEVGVLAALTAPLAEAGISLFAVSTWSTDYLLVPADRLPAAVAALSEAGHTVTGVTG